MTLASRTFLRSTRFLRYIRSIFFFRFARVYVFFAQKMKFFFGTQKDCGRPYFLCSAKRKHIGKAAKLESRGRL